MERESWAGSAFSATGEVAVQLSTARDSLDRWSAACGIPVKLDRHRRRHCARAIRADADLNRSTANNDFQCEEDYFRHGNSYLAIKLYCFPAGLNRLQSENNHLQAGNDRFEAGNDYIHNNQDCLSFGLDRYDGKQDRYSDVEDRYDGNKDRYDRGKDRYSRTGL